MTGDPRFNSSRGRADEARSVGDDTGRKDTDLYSMGSQSELHTASNPWISDESGADRVDGKTKSTSTRVIAVTEIGRHYYRRPPKIVGRDEKSYWDVLELDSIGDAEVDGKGKPKNGHEYFLHAFTIPSQGETLFMLAPECARELHYKNTHALLRNNESLEVVLAHAETDGLISRGIVPPHYRLPHVPVVSTLSAYRRFGSRIMKRGGKLAQ